METEVHGKDTAETPSHAGRAKGRARGGRGQAGAKPRASQSKRKTTNTQKRKAADIGNGSEPEDNPFNNYDAAQQHPNDIDTNELRNVNIQDFDVEEPIPISTEPNFFQPPTHRSESLDRILSSVSFIEEWKQYCRYGERAKTVRFSYDTTDTRQKDSELGASLWDFSSAYVPRFHEAFGSDPKTPAAGYDFVLNAGGSVWALDWCPKGPQVAANNIVNEYLTVGTHPPGCMYHKLGLPVSGKGIVQIWSICTSDMEQQNLRENSRFQGEKKVFDIQSGGSLLGQHAFQQPTEMQGEKSNKRSLDLVLHKTEEDTILTSVQPETCISLQYNGTNNSKIRGAKKIKDKARMKSAGEALQPEIISKENSLSLRMKGKNNQFKVCTDISLPKMVICLEHEGEVAWDLKWQPTANTNIQSQYCLGFLAVLLGDGSMQVWEVPAPSTVNYLYSLEDGKAGLDCRFIKLEPVFKCSKLQNGGHQSIPLTLEWSTALPHDLLLAGCHDGTVAVWKFEIKSSPIQDTRPLICFIGDSLAIRTLAWAPWEGDDESKNLIVTGGHSGNLRFWDLREPYKPLWDLHLSRGIILSLDWVNEPKCIMLTMDDGTIRVVSLSKAALDTPVTGMAFGGTHCQGLQSYYCSSFTIWSVHVSRWTGMVAYGSVDGSAIYFQLTQNAVEKDKMRHRTPHYLCGSFAVEDSELFKIVSPSGFTPVLMKKSNNEWTDTPRSIRGFLSETSTKANDTRKAFKNKQKSKGKKNKSAEISDDDAEGIDQLALVQSGGLGQSAIGTSNANTLFERFPPKQNAVQRVKWNPNRGSEMWLCYGGSSGLVRCQNISLMF